MAEQQSDRRPTEITIDAIKKHKISISLGSLGVIIGALWAAHGRLVLHVDRYFISSAEANELQQQVKEAADTAKAAAKIAQDTSTALFRYIRGEQLKDAREALETLKGQHSDTLLWERANGENDLSRARKRELEARIRAREAQITCMELGRDDCVL